MNLVAYFQGVVTELRKVTWPSLPTVGKYFLSVVLGIALATAVIAAFDFVFLRGLALILS
jgi:preprotein translocase SecE subunit